MENRTPNASPIACPSNIIFLAISRVPESVPIVSNVEWVNALIGLNERFPQSLTQSSFRIFGLTGALKPDEISISESATIRSVFSPEGSPNENRSPSTCLMIPGSDTSAAG